MLTVKPGTQIEFDCPQGTSPDYKVGDLIPSNPAEAVVTVIDTGDQSLALGPLKPGSFDLAISCSGQPQNFSFSLTVPEEAPEYNPPLDLEALSFPIWFFVAWAIIFSLLLGLLFWRKKRKKLLATPQTTEDLRPPLEKFYRNVKASSLLSRDDAETAERLYSEGNHALRSEIERALDFQAQWATSSEFIGAFKEAAPRFAKLSLAVSELEVILVKADQVRYSKLNPSKDERKDFFERIKGFEATLKSATKGRQDEVRES